MEQTTGNSFKKVVKIKENVQVDDGNNRKVVTEQTENTETKQENHPV